MNTVTCPRLCGGTFLTLILKVKKLNSETGKTFANSLVLREMAEIFADVNASTFRGSTAATTTSVYRACDV